MRALGMVAMFALSIMPALAQQEPPELRARLFPCMQPADPRGFTAIIAACNALLDDTTISLSSQRIGGIHISRANAYDELHDAAHARADYDAGIAADPASALGYYNRGLFLLRQKDAAAEADFAKTVSLNDGVGPAHFYLGQIAFDRGDYATALARFSRTIQLNPGNAQSYFRRGLTLMKMGQTDTAIGDLKIAVGLDPSLGKDILVDGKPLN